MIVLGTFGISKSRVGSLGIRPLRCPYLAIVFDISQTEGEDLPDLDAVRPKLIDGSAPDGIWDALAGHAGSIGYEVIRHQRGSENGYCDFLNKQIAVRPDVSEAQAVKTLIHELGHALLHAEGPVASREAAEVESRFDLRIGRPGTAHPRPPCEATSTH